MHRGGLLMKVCPVCGSHPEPYLTAWLARCDTCGLRLSLLDQATHNGTCLTGWDGDAERAMAPLREAAAVRLLTELGELTALRSKRLLDVGCGPGWFLDAAARAGLVAEGLEPDVRLAALGRDAGLAITAGSFPSTTANRAFDIVTFNDVFEHLPAPLDALAAVRDRLVPGGLLVLNLPTRTGAFYRVSEHLARIGMRGPLERMWQKGFESPHLFYYGSADLNAMIEAHGFACARGFTLPSVVIDKLWMRIRAGDRRPVAGDLAIFLATLAAIPLLGLLPSDIMVRIYRRL